MAQTPHRARTLTAVLIASAHAPAPIVSSPAGRACDAPARVPLMRGLTLGKFLPLHRGHELLLRVAAGRCDELTVLVGTTPDDPFSFAQREAWIRASLARSTQPVRAQLRVLEDPDPDPNVAKDASGTVTDERYWQAWLTQNANHLSGVDRVFTSDRYGGEIARRIGASWLPVDPERNANPISGSQILADPVQHFQHISEAARPDVGLTVAVLGAESTGKSTLVEALAATFGCPYAPEWGRIISEVKPELDVSDFDAIVDIQAQLIQSAQCSGNGLCLTDTEAITTALFGPLYLKSRHERAWAQARRQRFDLYLVLAPTVPWINDGTRILDDGQREAFHAAIVSALDELGYPYLLIEDASFEARMAAARQAIDCLARARGFRLTARCTTD